MTAPPPATTLPAGADAAAPPGPPGADAAARAVGSVEECATGAAVALLPEAEAQAQAAVLKALADPVRLRLLHHIASTPGGTACACTLPDALGISQPTMSHHLAKLVDAGLLTRERRGRWAHYSVATDGVRRQLAALQTLLEPVRPAHPQRRAALR